jgi:hypothetical protein
LAYTFVMPGLVPGIHVLNATARKTWMAGTSPAMTWWAVPYRAVAAIAARIKMEKWFGD